jgi:hypothetical protein
MMPPPPPHIPHINSKRSCRLFLFLKFKAKTKLSSISCKDAMYVEFCYAASPSILLHRACCSPWAFCSPSLLLPLALANVGMLLPLVMMLPLSPGMLLPLAMMLSPPPRHAALLCMPLYLGNAAQPKIET